MKALESSWELSGMHSKRYGPVCTCDVSAGMPEVEQASAPYVCAKWEANGLLIQI